MLVEFGQECLEVGWLYGCCEQLDQDEVAEPWILFRSIDFKVCQHILRFDLHLAFLLKYRISQSTWRIFIINLEILRLSCLTGPGCLDLPLFRLLLLQFQLIKLYGVVLFLVKKAWLLGIFCQIMRLLDELEYSLPAPTSRLFNFKHTSQKGVAEFWTKGYS